ncbi:TonB-dependent receptor family protein [Dokdonia sinensis]|uniref:TonB-dependent receptor family protein n=1 Tax=Dokdonia sinensis TaxID=2479847 RepID=UPI001374C269|nr:TonB-dependent receptor [Dokdonia sinensis]
MTHYSFLSLFFFLSVVVSSYAQTNTILPQQIDTVVITASRIKIPLKKAPQAISIFNASPISESKPQQSLQEYIQQMPGVFAQNANNYAQDLRISIRGFGARAAFGIRGIKLMVDGIPETTPDGQGQLDNLNLGIINRIEVIKGASSSLYGNASGGVIQIETTDFESSFAKAKITQASYAFQNYQVTTGFGDLNANIVIHGSYAASDGYRDHSGFIQNNLNAKGSFIVNDKLKIKSILNYSNSPKADDAGGLTAEEVEENRRQARDRNLLFDGGERISQLKAGGSFEYTFSDIKRFSGYAFYNRRDFENKLPFENGGQVQLERDYIGQGLSFSYDKGSYKLQTGYDFGYQNDNRQRFNNLEGDRGALTLDQAERFTNLGVYLVQHLELNKWYFTTGVRFDYNKLAAIDAFLEDDDDSGDITLNGFNPSIGASYAIAQKHTLFTNFSTGFETPALSELSANPDGGQGFNESLKSQSTINFELGLRGRIASNFSYNFATFYIETQDDLVPFELEAFQGRTFFRNAGETMRKGIEIEAAYAFAKAWNISSSFTQASYTYKNYMVTDTDFSGNDLPGIPQTTFSSSINYVPLSGFYGSINSSILGSLFADDANETKVDGYELVNIVLGYHHKFKKWTFKPFVGVNNLLDERYNDNVRINAFGGRYFEPALGFNVYGGILINL